MIQPYFFTYNLFHLLEMMMICIKIMTIWERGTQIPGKYIL